MPEKIAVISELFPSLHAVQFVPPQQQEEEGVDVEFVCFNPRLLKNGFPVAGS